MKGNMKNNINAKRVALSGILGAFAVICLFLAAILPTGRLGFYTLSSFFIAVIIMEYGAKAGWLFYVATGILSFFIIPDKLGVLPYVFFFGIYGVVKYFIEKLDKFVPELLIKLVFFNLCLGAAYLLLRQIFADAIAIKLPWYALLAAAEAAFVFYDYLYSLFIAYYRDKLRKFLKI